jgi:cyclic pyranopterin phosphate synthase
MLKDAGLNRVTVSLDALDDETFKSMNDVDYPVETVLDGIRTAADAGLGPIKINAVVKRGVNEHSVVDLASYFRGTGHIVRFIEYMDVGTTNGWRLDDVVPAAEMVESIHEKFPLEPLEPNYPGEVARRYRYQDGGGEIGVIASVTQPFCGDCTRVRLSPDGSIFTCLFSGTGTDLKGLLRSGADDAEIGEVIDRVWSARADRYSEIRSSQTVSIGQRVEMSYIGG